MESVKFIKPWNIYSRGDVAGFEPEQAKALIDGRVAEAHKAEAKSAKADAK